MSRRALLRSVEVATAAAGIPLARAEMSSAVTAPFIPYSAASFFKSRVTSAPVDAARTSEFHSFMSTFPEQRAYSAPSITYHLGGSDPSADTSPTAQFCRRVGRGLTSRRDGWFLDALPPAGSARLRADTPRH
jgi:hypothetical protein